MGQVPHYLVIGDGRMARHARHYLDLLGLPHQGWSRQKSRHTELAARLDQSTHVLLLISDSAIEDFVRENTALGDRGRMLVHFSGALHTPLAWSAHPLMTFADRYYARDLYQRMAFVIEEEGPAFSELLPGLPNTSYRIPSALKPHYHALCVLGGNFTTLLWTKVFSAMGEKLSIPPHAVRPYLEAIAANLMSPEAAPLTGPLVRGDMNTIHRNLEALDGDPYQEVYRAFVHAFQQEKKHEHRP